MTAVSMVVPRVRLAQLASLMPQAPAAVHAIGRFLAKHLNDSTIEPVQFVMAYELVLCAVEGRLPNLPEHIEDCLKECKEVTDVLRAWTPRVASMVFSEDFATQVAALLDNEIARINEQRRVS